MESTILHLEGTFSQRAAHPILGLQPVPLLNNGRQPDIQ
ncbi:hypothetical protein C8K66_10166 [Pseudomonas sp. GV105]|jgi:hypothetical protein|nr:hypothetical protein C8K66_10166 [Pseudomonas sp. GV105]